MFAYSYGRVFHPQILLHELIANLVLWHVVADNAQKGGWVRPEEIDSDSPTCPLNPGDPGDPDPDPNETPVVLHYKGTARGKQIKKGTELRILPMGDSITVGFLSQNDGGDGDGYRRQLRDNLSSKTLVKKPS